MDALQWKEQSCGSGSNTLVGTYGSDAVRLQIVYHARRIKILRTLRASCASHDMTGWLRVDACTWSISGMHLHVHHHGSPQASRLTVLACADEASVAACRSFFVRTGIRLGEPNDSASACVLI